MKPALKIFPFVYLVIGIIAFLLDRTGMVDGIENERMRGIADAILWVGKFFLYVGIPSTLYVLIRMVIANRKSIDS